MTLYLIAALAQNRVIGNNGRIPWDLPEDLRLFQRRTTGHTVLMGRRTFDLLPEPLPNRRNVVLTHRPIPSIESFPSLDEALSAVAADGEVYVIGGGSVYAQTIERADGMVLSHVHQEPEGDAFFPEYENLLGSLFEQLSLQKHTGFDLVEYRRVSTK